jgi:hypothetical protein
LIVGGGYHGKSTLLRCIAAGVYNKLPGDGREWCVSVDDAVVVRAEDGRPVQNCNISAFISNLPAGTKAAAATTTATEGTATRQTAMDTAHFSTDEASGSTSQASNVVEAIETGASALLVDEDVSAANFMARDGRMRALIQDESITPLLYRVNGLYDALGISSIVVVGGVGDWLDVPHHVILMDKYLCQDATEKARSVSKQFSHGHVQYGGRGVVHRLEWDKAGTPIPRRPSEETCRRFDRKRTSVSLMDGMDGILLQASEEENGGNRSFSNGYNANGDAHFDEDDPIDMSRCEQLLGKRPQLYGTGLCTLSLMDSCRQPEHTDLGMADLLVQLDAALDDSGLVGCLTDEYTCCRPPYESSHWKLLVETMGFAYRPRRFEVGQALTRMRFVKLEEISVEADPAELAAQAEAVRKKQEFLDMWSKRRASKSQEG